ncbi:MAG: hypothetical protein GTN62_14960 [Gemmatimonadales bacterium]|nr:hypothetical protein [Gemmatimonadales bacterium]NIN13386.1 hypothetical protein [Gemmatimonadales bacterium]NIN51389.1 hypothetical protein [Gemmatimonadales bacterium]NIP08853.1 hypothetical protein [Gemmatimonadales bacterium]NIQ99847.1 hypothetical protein [Gemmatimonadales bacterium]
MDPICHTLVGATLAETGLKRRTALGAATLIIGANLPDLDILTYVDSGVTALWFRRGVTHGLPAVVLLPLLLTGGMLAWDRLVRRRGRPPPVHVAPLQILLLAFIAVVTHPVLDFMNTYGMRWLMPFSDAWYYGDTLFIVDPWIWAVLVAGIYLARKRPSAPVRRFLRSPAAASLGALALYIAAMATSNVVARSLVTRSLLEAGYDSPARLMVAPRPVTPFRRWVVIQDGELYRFGTFHWFRRPQFDLEGYTYERHPSTPAAAVATRGPRVRKFLSWARFPYSIVEERTDRYLIHVGDARYTVDPEASWAAITVEVEK